MALRTAPFAALRAGEAYVGANFVWRSRIPTLLGDGGTLTNLLNALGATVGDGRPAHCPADWVPGFTEAFCGHVAGKVGSPRDRRAARARAQAKAHDVGKITEETADTRKGSEERAVTGR